MAKTKTKAKAAAPKAEPEAPAGPSREEAARTAEALKVVKRHMGMALGVGLLPIALLDLVLISGIQLRMVRKLADLYEVAFSEGAVKAVIFSLVGGGVTLSLAGLAFPAGKWFGKFGLGASSGATTYAVGRVFMQDYESGGEFLTLSPDRIKSFYDEQLEEGKKETRKSFVGVRP